jgi:hypothetical protein
MSGTLNTTVAATLVVFIAAGAAVAAAQIGGVEFRQAGGASTLAKPVSVTPHEDRLEVLTSAEKRDIERAVRVQLLALATQDAESAFAKLAPSVQRRFGKPDLYWQTLAVAVPQILDTRHFSFLGSERGKNRIVQQVLTTDSSGEQWLIEFEVVRQAGTDWRVEGCTIEPAPGQEA